MVAANKSWFSFVFVTDLLLPLLQVEQNVCHTKGSKNEISSDILRIVEIALVRCQCSARVLLVHVKS